MEKNDANKNARKLSRFHVPQRWITIVVLSFTLFNGAAMQFCLSIALTKMVEQVDSEVKIGNDTCPDRDYVQTTKKYLNKTSSVMELFDWSEYTQGIILSSFYWAYLVTSVTASIPIRKLGGKSTLAYGTLSTAVLTLFTPVSTIWGGSIGLISVRVLLGIGQGWIFPAVHTVIAQWIPPHERSLAGTISFSGYSLGIIFSMTASGLILQYSEYGWPLVFYFLGGVGILSWMTVYMFCYDRPANNPFISSSEMRYLKRNQKDVLEDLPPTPWHDILTSKPFWALLVVSIGALWTFTIITVDIPKYMSGVLKLSAENTGYSSSIPTLLKWIFSFAMSFISDYLIANEKMSITRVRMIATTLCTFGSALFIVAASYAGCNQSLFVIFLAIAMSLKGCIYCSILINPLDLSPNHSGVVMGLANGMGTFSSIFAPYIVGLLTPNQSMSEWRLIFWSIFIIATVTNVIYLMFGSGEVQDWNYPRSSQKKEATVEELQLLTPKISIQSEREKISKNLSNTARTDSIA
ncbi:hypothetical protein QAD02_019178 [Eretmocerus hayati]|uniref:Uncharacterized protein n=1 Tax=Eretmocerus hayati TaxID=131215 RepID=A0ACC2PK19_9HYME|nr:hypothetical protein QAD02_019178 [Eretmocerus hayati]